MMMMMIMVVMAMVVVMLLVVVATVVPSPRYGCRPSDECPVKVMRPSLLTCPRAIRRHMRRLCRGG